MQLELKYSVIPQKKNRLKEIAGFSTRSQGQDNSALA